MPSLLDLPDEILVEIAQYVLGLDSTGDETDAPAIRVFSHDFVAGVPDWVKRNIIQQHAKSKADPPAMILASRRLNTIATTLLLSKAVFCVDDTPDLRLLLSKLGPERRHLLKNVSVTLHSNEDYEHDPQDEDTAQRDIDEATGLLGQLPSKLRCLFLEMPYHPHPPFSYQEGTDVRLRETMNKFSELQELQLMLETHYVHIDMFTNMTANVYTIIHEWVEPPAPKFPLLTRLHLQGCLTPMIAPRGLATALSESQLPCLEALVLDGILHASDDENSLVFEAAALEGMHPLREFCWIPYDFDSSPRKTLGVPHSPPTKQHLEQLKMRHGETLRVLNIDFGERESCNGPWDLDIDQEYLDKLQSAMPHLREVSLEMGSED
ncbi:metallophosphoesterase [Purpureocillium lavendulum]|uniref:Metallophosphoesterase n=1 Tax=Purpureocillium lavendulum TaxID=1247861 RepID=A0AB34G6N9_9HYPO|nr:metallophosphoesterase [Purpureocillium lavendulum]